MSEMNILALQNTTTQPKIDRCLFLLNSFGFHFAPHWITKNGLSWLPVNVCHCVECAECAEPTKTDRVYVRMWVYVENYKQNKTQHQQQ